LEDFVFFGSKKDSLVSSPKEVTMGRKEDKREGLLAYAHIVHRAKLNLKCKALLWHYAFTYNWNERKASYYTQDQICAYVGISPTTYQRAKSKLIELKWIITEKKSMDLPVFVAPAVGIDDPDYSKMSWSKGHEDNKLKLEDALNSLPEQFRDPLGENISSDLDSN
jgi:hypothetical protein